VRHLVSPEYILPKKPLRSVVVIDEIDKASRDFPNDLLNEIDQLWFRVPELAGVVPSPETPRAPMSDSLRPVIVITSNLERQLPDAFLRRCVFHHIEHPDRETMDIIVLGHLKRAGVKLDDAELREAIDLVDWARQERFDKPPGLAELIEFARALGLSKPHLSSNDFRQAALRSVSVLGKTTRDVEALRQRLS
jgi:MoxR-like ATPase